MPRSAVHTGRKPAPAAPRPLALIERISRRIVASARAHPGRIFTPSDFSDLGTPQAVGMALLRLERRGVVRRVGRGLYQRPRVHPRFGPLLPSADEVAQALAAKGHLKLQPSGAYAANLLGLTEQVPLKLVFLTDGVSRTVRVGQQQVILRRANPSTMATAGRMSGLVIQALRHLKRENVDDTVIAKLRRRLSSEDSAALPADARHAPAWIAAILRDLANGEG
jgi:hypothetical protein